MRTLALAVGLAALAGCITSAGTPEAVETASATADGDCLRDLNGLDLQDATIADLRGALAAGTITSVELVQAYLVRIEAFDDGGPMLNSIQLTDPDVLAKAAALDAERAAGRVRGPLHGIPIILKDNIDATGMPNTAGSIALAENLAPEDAFLAAKLRDTGAIVLGKAQLSEFAHWRGLTIPSGWSSLGGQVVNAYTGGDPSGSSSGSGVAASMAFASATIGTETSGSILSPSNANSVVGVKPTTGLVSRTGIIPIAASFDTAGPMTRNVYDAALVLGAVAGPDPADPRTAESAAHLPPGNDYTAFLTPDALDGVRLGYKPTGNQLFNRAMRDLEAVGAELVPIDTNDAEDVSLTEIPLLFNEFKFGLNLYLEKRAADGLPVGDLTDIIVYNVQHPENNDEPQDLLIGSDATPGLNALSEAAIIPVLALNRAVADDLFASNDVDAIIGPNAPFTGLGAAAGYPTVTVPSGYNGNRPQGLSFFGPAWSEPQLLSYAHAYEQATMRRAPPTTITPSLLTGVCDGVDAGPFVHEELLAAGRDII